MTGLVARVVTDVAGIDKEFDYLVPPAMEGVLGIGDQVRLQLGPRRVGGWVLALEAVTSAPATSKSGTSESVTSESVTSAPVTRESATSARARSGSGAQPGARILRPVAKRRGIGPDAAMVDLAGWAAWRWAARRATFLSAASAEHAITRLPRPATRPPAPPSRLPIDGPLPAEGGVHLFRIPPASDPTPIVAGAAQAGPTLVVIPTHARAEVLAGRLRRAGADVALLPGDWEQARAGAGVVVGARAAAWGPCPGLAAAVVIDGHDETLTEEGAPTWSAVSVTAERARRAGVPCLVVSSCPTPELLSLGALHTPDRVAERRGWATVEVIDRRGDDPRLGLYSTRLVNLIRAAGEAGPPGADAVPAGARVACVLNRTGRLRLLACASCGELVRCEQCASAMSSPEPGVLLCRYGHRRPTVCACCTSSRLRSLRIGVSRAREDLETLSGQPVGEVTGSTKVLPDAAVLVGTEALLHRLDPTSGVAAVAFVDFDQELLAPRMRAADEALALIAHASRIVRGSAGRVLVQTRLPEHPVLQAASAADPALSSDAQIPVRKALGLPPFSSLAIVRGEAASAFSESIRVSASGEPDVRVDGPDGDRWMIRAADHRRLCDVLASAGRPPMGTLRVAVDPARL